MVVVVAEYLPEAIRGRMKMWFVETKPNVFVSGIKDSVADDVVNYLIQHCPDNSALLIFQQINKPPGYKIRSLGLSSKPIVLISGLQLICEKMSKSNIPKDHNM